MIFSKYLVFDSGVFQLYQIKKLKTGSESGQSWQFLVYATPESRVVTTNNQVFSKDSANESSKKNVSHYFFFHV